jgi:hypothetical protein
VRGDEAFTKVLNGWVDGSALLDEILALLATYFHFANHSQAALVALWIAHTYLYDLFPWTPYLGVSSPTKRCGKSRLLEILGCARRPQALQPASAALFRIIEKYNPTILLINCAPSRAAELQQAIRGVLNAGAKRGGCATRVVGRARIWTFRTSTFLPEGIGGIGYPPDTVADRAIVLHPASRSGESAQRKGGSVRFLTRYAARLGLGHPAFASLSMALSEMPGPG